MQIKCNFVRCIQNLLHDSVDLPNEHQIAIKHIKKVQNLIIKLFGDLQGLDGTERERKEIFKFLIIQLTSLIIVVYGIVTYLLKKICVKIGISIGLIT